MDAEFVHRAMGKFGALVLGCNMFGLVRGPWPAGSRRRWWGNNLPYPARQPPISCITCVGLCHGGGTSFHFVTSGIHGALARAIKAAGRKEFKVGGGVSTVRQYLQAGLIDSVHLVSTPVLLDQSEPPLHGLDLDALGFCVTDRKPSEYATHFVLNKVAIQT